MKTRWTGVMARRNVHARGEAMKNRNLVVRLDDVELAQIHRLAEVQDEPATRLVRKWIRMHYEASFGVQAPTRSRAKGGR